MTNPLGALFHVAPNENFEVKRQNRLRLAGSFLAAPLLLWIVYRTARPELAPWLTRSLGACCLAGGVALRWWATRCIAGRKKRMLVTWGPYCRLRNPLYGGSLLMALGACAYVGAPAAGLLAAGLYLLLYLPSIRAEERFLAHQFGSEWHAYRSVVPALVPRIGARWPSLDPGEVLRQPLRDVVGPALLAGMIIAAAELLRRFHVGVGPSAGLF